MSALCWPGRERFFIEFNKTKVVRRVCYQRPLRGLAKAAP